MEFCTYQARDKMRIAHTNFIREYEGKNPLVRPRIRWEGNTKKLLNEIYIIV